MSAFAKSALFYVLLALFSIPLFYINVHELHGWGDDFAQYIKQAQNIAEGKPYYQSGYIFHQLNPLYAPAQYPPVFSYILAPVVKIWGLSLKHMQLAISACMAAWLFVLYHFYQRYTNKVTAVCLSLICVYVSGLMEIKTDILSDIPCLLFVTIYFTLRASPDINQSKLKFTLAIVAALLAIFTRTQSLCIILAEGIYLFFILLGKILRERRLSLKDIYGSFSFKVSLVVALLYILLDNTIFSAPAQGGGTLSFYTQLFSFRSDSTLWQRIGGGMYYFHSLMDRMFQYYPDDVFCTVLYYFIKHVIIACIIIGFLMTMRTKFEVSHIYVILVCILLIIMGQTPGLRVIIYGLPFFVRYVHRAMYAIFPPIFRVKPTRLAIVFTITYLVYARFEAPRYDATPDHYMPRAHDLAAFDYIRKNVDDSSIIIFARPRALTLFTDKRSIVMAPVSNEENKTYFNNLQGKKYLLVNDALHEDYYKQYMEAVHPATDTVSIAQGYTLYTLQ